MNNGKYREWITDDALLRVKGWARDGLSNAQIADNIGISTVTFYDWCNKYAKFSNAVKKGREPIAVKVEDAFYSKCKWNEWEETKEEKIENSDGSWTTKTTTTRHPLPPDTAALIFALKNLMPQKYRDKPQAIDTSTEEKHNALVDAIKAAITDD